MIMLAERHVRIKLALGVFGSQIWWLLVQSGAPYLCA